MIIKLSKININNRVIIAMKNSYYCEIHFLVMNHNTWGIKKTMFKKYWIFLNETKWIQTPFFFLNF